MTEGAAFCSECGAKLPGKGDESNSNEFLLYVDRQISETTVFRSVQELLCCKILGMMFWVWLGAAVLINGMTIVFAIKNLEALSLNDEETCVTFIILAAISFVIDTGGRKIIDLVMEKMYMKQPLKSFGGTIQSKFDMNALVSFLNIFLKELSSLWSDAAISSDGRKIDLSFNGTMVWIQFSALETQGVVGQGVYYSIGIDRKSASVLKLDSQIKAVPVLRAAIDYYESIVKEKSYGLEDV